MAKTYRPYVPEQDLKVLYNFTDPESRIMKGPDGFMQAYNGQVAVNELQLIVAQAVTQATNDKHQLLPMITTIAQQAGDTPTQVLADAGCCSDENLAAIATTGIAETRRTPGVLSAWAPAEDRHARRADDAKAPDQGGRRGLCQTQDDGRTGAGTNQAGESFRQFLLRGVAKLQGEWALVCTTHNIVKLYRLCA